ncbi:CTP synthase [Nemania sp. FL0031]|nr:CTP synthase [Nemania sp. FL0031]
MKYVVVTGGVISGVGKGTIASSIGLLLKTAGLKVTMIKIDPYMNVDAGTMAPAEHGECFVLADGGEVDLDLGNYERYLDITLTSEHSITTGKIYDHVIKRERRGDYLGKTVQVIPHLTDAIQEWIQRVASIPVDETLEAPDACVIELGGTVGDIENGPFVEALCQLKRRVGKCDYLHIHVSLIPIVQGEQKTKPTQQAIRTVRSAGLNPDLIACRCTDKLDTLTIGKVANHCQVNPDQVIAIADVASTYLVPVVLESQGLIPSISSILDLQSLDTPLERIEQAARRWASWKTLTAPSNHLKVVTIALVGKYTRSLDAYASLVKALQHASMACKLKLDLVLVDASHLESPLASTPSSKTAEYESAWRKVCAAQGILVPGGFGARGSEGMIEAAKYARENKVPFLGICLGMQIAVIDFARNVCGLSGANSVELDPETPSPVIINMPELDYSKLGGTMRLGERPTRFQPGSGAWSKARAVYTSCDPQQTCDHNSDELVIRERHRHRYEVNPSYIETLARHGLEVVGKDEAGERMEILELRDHPWFVGVQFHPEYQSKVLDPSKSIMGFVAASARCLQ